uniref:FANCI helical domain-containing protein n=1 Tax=Panagrolaimus superbus TaxID=310955 RepID=A0A914Z6U8_9BILA
MVYYFIDALVELRSKNGGVLITNWEIFEKIADHICDLPSEVGVKVMSALMPVIIQQDDLRKKIFESLKVKMISVSTVSTVLPIMFQLLRSLIEQPETKRSFQCPQSFASFPSQLCGSQQKESSNTLDAISIIECIKRCMLQSSATKCLVYKQENNYFILHGLDLLLVELSSLPKLKVGEYTVKIDGVYYLKFPCPHLLKATLAILSAAAIGCENTVQFCQSQLSQNGADTVVKAEVAVEKYIEYILSVHLEDLQLDNNNSQLSNPTTGSDTMRYKIFGSMIIQLYDVIIERLWTLILRRKTLSELLETKPKSDDDAKKSTKAKNGKEMDAKKESLGNLKSVVHDLQIDIPKLSVMLKNLDLPPLDVQASNDGSHVKDIFMSWLISRIHDSVSLLDPKSSTCLASKDSLTSMACSLLKFFWPPLTASADDRPFVNAQTKAIEAYSKILIYILSKYEGKCAETLKEIFEKVIFSEYDAGPAYPQYTQVGQYVAKVAEMEIDQREDDNINAAGFDSDFRVYSSKHIAAYYQKILPGIFSTRHLFETRKTLDEYCKQIYSFIAVASKLSSMLTSSSNEIRKNVIELILEVAEKYKIEDKNTTNEFWKTALDIIAHSNCDDYWMKLFDELIDVMIAITSRDNSDYVIYKSLHTDIAPQFYVNIVRTVSRLLAKVRTAINVKTEIGDEITDEFLEIICCTVEIFAKNVFKIVKIDNSIVTENEQMVTAALEMLTDFYSTMNCITQQFKAAKGDVASWDSLYAFDRVLGHFVDLIIKECANKFGRSKYTGLKSSKSTKASAAKKAKTDEERQQAESVRRNKKDERLFVRLDKEFETFHGALIMIEEKYGSEAVALDLPSAKDKAMSVFKNDEKALAQVCGGKRKIIESGEEDNNDKSDEEEDKNRNDKSDESEEEDKNDDKEECNKSEEEGDKSDQDIVDSDDNGYDSK